MLRVIHNGELLLTSSDEYFFKNFKKMTWDEHDQFNVQRKDSALYQGIKAVKGNLKSAVVRKVDISLSSDMYIDFNNDTRIEIITDCRSNDYEYYRILSQRDNCHYVVLFENGCIVCDKQLGLEKTIE